MARRLRSIPPFDIQQFWSEMISIFQYIDWNIWRGWNKGQSTWRSRRLLRRISSSLTIFVGDVSLGMMIRDGRIMDHCVPISLHIRSIYCQTLLEGLVGYFADDLVYYDGDIVRYLDQLSDIAKKMEKRHQPRHRLREHDIRVISTLCKHMLKYLIFLHKNPARQANIIPPPSAEPETPPAE